MSISRGLLPEFDHEMSKTRIMLERVPDGSLGWRPHDKSMTLGGLTTHVANVPSWGAMTLLNDSLDTAPVGEEPFRIEEVTSGAEAIERFDRNVAETRAALEDASDDHLMTPWSLLSGGEVVFTMPRIAVFRSMIMNHMIHHRGQLGVYLRMNDVPLPALYGPTADESG